MGPVPCRENGIWRTDNGKDPRRVAGSPIFLPRLGKKGVYNSGCYQSQVAQNRDAMIIERDDRNRVAVVFYWCENEFFFKLKVVFLIVSAMWVGLCEGQGHAKKIGKGE